VTIEELVKELERLSDLRAKASVEAMRKGHHVISANMIKDAAKLNDAVAVVRECFDQSVST
jgi:hypothetical protein